MMLLVEKTLRHDFKAVYDIIDGQTEIIEHTENSGITVHSSIFKYI